MKYKYDHVGNLLEREDGNGRVTFYRYDALNRRISEEEKGKEGTRREYLFDKVRSEYGDARNVKGRLVGVRGPNVREYYSYWCAWFFGEEAGSGAGEGF